MADIKPVSPPRSSEESRIGDEKLDDTHSPAYLDEAGQVHPDGTPFSSTARSYGVRRTELMTAQFSTTWLKIAFYVAAFLCSYVYALDGTLRSTFTVYATSSYSQHSLYTAVAVIRAVIAAASQPTYARLSDRFGRLELFLVSIVFYVVGTIIQSQAYDVQRFAGGAVLYQIGYSGVQLLLEVTLSDMSTLNWRLFASFIPALPFIINTWASGYIAADILADHGWSYGVWIWAIIFPAASVPLLGCFIYMRVAAGRTEEWAQIKAEEKEEQKGKNIFKELFWQLDVVGILLIICVFGFILVPFTLAGNKTASLVTSSEAWKQAKIIAPLVVGVCLIPVLILWEGKWARFPIVPFALLKDRGVWAALIIACLVNFIWYMPNSFMYTVLVVGLNTSILAAIRITSLYSFVSVITGPLLGFVLVKVRRTKAFIIFGCAMWFVAMGILYHFRGSNDGVNNEYVKHGIIGGECLMGFGAGFFTYVTQLSIQTCTNHEYMAVVLSLYLASYNIGSALGSAVSGAIWTQLMPSTIAQYMEALGADPSTATEAYQSPFTFITEYAWGSSERIAVALAYADIQRKMIIVALCLCALMLVMSLLLRDHYLASVQSLDQVHDHRDGVNGSQPVLGRTVVVNDYDNDPIAQFFRGIFKRNNAQA
ncbi:MFS general substrate transporter [Metschnikowia bicuspidata var. bicuspidata NRRL YB-4993]|uniref:MFS general substrate transporter n=1 Tax=Metschnikowia bicuspidata var. bicuspidata NRRL YB-4993 TaxID=869754 RepID=A0A1A0H8I7_9ASCO|nr:MFS general substrate transporter [Metschnikowia bicuspidata var. bicuspidata NRRL YB-4993]OBA20305.1 MFS general substrate transporter [Metschnikowia bicuspidata var. bicuspidata NRRL YB-4993]